MASASLMLPPAPRRPSVGRAAKVATPRSSSALVAVGARVEAAWHGKYYGAQVTALAGTQSAQVLFDDGLESTVAVSEIRAARLLEGTSVELRADDQDWAPGKVVRTRRDGSYDVELQSGEVHKSALPINVREAVGPCAPTSPDAITPPASPEETASLAVSPPAKTHAFSIGDTVEANCRGLGQYHMGVVTAILDDGSFRISYTDGDCENGVPERYIRRVQTRRRPSKAARPGSSASARSPLKAIHNKRKSGANLESDRAAKKHGTYYGAASPAPEGDASAVVYCDSGYPLALSQQLQIWDGQGDVLPHNEMPRGRSSMEFYDVYGSTLSPKRQNEALGQRSVSGCLSLNLPGVVSETPYYYRKQKQHQIQQQRYSKQQPGYPASNLPASESYIKGGKSEAQIESEVDYELDIEDETWLEALNRTGKEQCGKDWGMFLEEDMEVLIDRYEKADATLHKLAGHSAVRTEILLHERPAVPDVRGVSTMVQQQVHEWWMEKRTARGEQLLRRFRAPPDEDDEDDAKAFRRVSIGSRMASPLQRAASATASPAAGPGVVHQVGDMVEANYHGRGQYFGGIIAAVNPNGSFAVKYHDGDSENEVPSVFIRKMATRRRRASAPPQDPSANASGTTAAANGARGSFGGPSKSFTAAATDQQTAPLNDGMAACGPASGAVGVADVGERSVQSQHQLPPSPKSAGDIVEANYHGLGRFYTGTISAVNPNGTYRVQYHDGDCEDEVPAFDVRRLTNRRRRSTQQPPQAEAAPAPTPRPIKQEDTAAPLLSTRDSQTEAVVKTAKTKTAKTTAPAKPISTAKPTAQAKEQPLNVKKEKAKPKVKSKANRKSADPLLISKQQAFSLHSGDRVLLQWDEPEDKDHGVWFAATVTSDGTSCGWFELEFDTFSVSNTSSWNLPYHASKGRLRRAATTAASRIRRGAGGPVLEWSRSMGGSVLPADQVTPRRAAASSTANDASGEASAGAQNSNGNTGPSPSEVERERQTAEEELEALKAGPPPSPKAVGDIIEANYHGRGKWYSGIVAAADTGSGYRIQYHDGDSEDNVPAWYVKRMAARSRRPRQPESPPLLPCTDAPEDSTNATASGSAGTQPASDLEPAPKRARKHQQQQQPQQPQDSGSDESLWQMLWSELVKVGWHQASNPFRQQKQPPSDSAATTSEHDTLYFAPARTEGNKANAVLDSKAAVFRFLAKASRNVTSGHAKSSQH